MTHTEELAIIHSIMNSLDKIGKSLNVLMSSELDVEDSARRKDTYSSYLNDVDSMYDDIDLIFN